MSAVKRVEGTSLRGLIEPTRGSAHDRAEKLDVEGGLVQLWAPGKAEERTDLAVQLP
jgi:hypothetical protein